MDDKIKQGLPPTCAWHDEEIREMKKNVSFLFEEYTNTKEFKGQAKIAGIIALAIFAASFIYTFNHTRDAQGVYNDFSRNLTTIETRVDKIETAVMIGTDRYERLIRDLDKIDSKVTEIADKLNQFDKRGVYE